MFYDLNIPYAPNDPDVIHTLRFLAERAYHKTSYLPSNLPTHAHIANIANSGLHNSGLIAEHQREASGEGRTPSQTVELAELAESTLTDKPDTRRRIAEPAAAVFDTDIRPRSPTTNQRKDTLERVHEPGM